MKTITSILFLLFFFQLSAQKMLLGPEIGMNLVKVDEQDFGDNYQPGFYAGGAFEYQFENFLSLKTGFYVSQKRQAYSAADTSLSEIFSFIGTASIPGVDLSTYTTTYSRQSQTYLEIPIMAGARWKGLEVFGGGYFGFMMVSKRKDKEVSNTPFISTIDIEALLGDLGGAGGFLTSLLPQAYEESLVESTENSNLNFLDYGLKAGVGYSKDQFGFYVNYNFGLSDFRKDKMDLKKQTHQYFQFSLRYMFEISKKSRSSIL